MAKLVLVNYWSKGIGNDKPPLGLGYLASYVKKYLNFHDIAIVNTGDQIFQKMIKYSPGIVGFTFIQQVFTMSFSKWNRSKKNCRSQY
jgi:hypothetical protein